MGGSACLQAQAVSETIQKNPEKRRKLLKTIKKLRNPEKSTAGGTLDAPWAHFGRSWALFRPFRALLGRPWALSGRSWDALGRSWASLGRLLDALGRNLEKTWVR